MRRRGNRAIGPGGRAGMLVLSRKPDEGIMVGDLIEISILSIKDGKVKIGITAPDSVPVFRKEVYLRIADKELAAPGSPRLSRGWRHSGKPIRRRG